MHEELQVLSPLVGTREFYFLRYCQQIEQGMWAVADVSYDFPREGPQLRSHRLPSGCLIQDMPNGYSKVTWVEHLEIEDKAPTHRLYRDLVHSGAAFGAHRWLSTLQRMCERLACLMVSATSTRDLGGGNFFNPPLTFHYFPLKKWKYYVLSCHIYIFFVLQ